MPRPSLLEPPPSAARSALTSRSRLTTLTALAFALAFIGAAASVSGCLGSTQTSPKGPDGMSCGQRLVGGAWKFIGFTPDQPLQPDAAQALERLHGSLRLQFNGQQALTTGPGLNHVGPYQILDDDGLSCRIVAPDDSGVVTETQVRFLDGNHIEVLDRRSAVPGRSRMERVAPGY